MRSSAAEGTKPSGTPSPSLPMLTDGIHQRRIARQEWHAGHDRERPEGAAMGPPAGVSLDRTAVPRLFGARAPTLTRVARFGNREAGCQAGRGWHTGCKLVAIVTPRLVGSMS